VTEAKAATFLRRPKDRLLPAPSFDAFDGAFLARNLARQALPLLVVLHLARTASKLGFLAAAASSIGLLMMGDDLSLLLLASVPALLLLTILINSLADRATIDAEARLARQLRDASVAHLAAMTGPVVRTMSRGQLTVAMQRYPQALAALAIGHRIARMMMAAGPLMTAAALAFISWQAAALVLLLTPVMVVFFILVGDMIQKRAEAQERAFSRLAGQFADRVRALPTIVANHAALSEKAKLADRLATYADKTMAVLGIAFLNAAVIDFFASLSIAMLAVFLGLGHLKLAMIPGFSNIELWQSLFILMLAPEFFAPFKRFSEQYHVKAEGVAASKALDALLNPAGLELSGTSSWNMTLPPLPQRGLVAFVGPSGSGKSTLLRRLAGVDPAEHAVALPTADIAWVSTDIHMEGGTVRDALIHGSETRDEQTLRSIAEAIGLLHDTLLPGGLEASIAEGGTNLSGGQRLRIALARAAISGRTIIADEPTAKLDAAAAQAVRSLLRSIAATRLVVVATHDPELAVMADRRIQMTSGDLEGALL
jgi:ABC-type transport system involved in cytochrome bd biosynthesis fused ATPase/permease subunit